MQAALLLDVAETLNGFGVKDSELRVEFRMERPGFRTEGLRYRGCSQNYGPLWLGIIWRHLIVRGTQITDRIGSLGFRKDLQFGEVIYLEMLGYPSRGRD